MDPAIGTGIAVVVVIVIVLALLLRGRLRGEPRHIDADFEQQLRARQPDLDPDTAPRADHGVEPPQPADVEAARHTDAVAPADDTEVGGASRLEVPPDAAAEAAPREAPLTPLERFRRRLSRARGSLGTTVAGIFGRGISEDAWEELEEALISADVGVEATLELVETVRDRCRAEGARTGEEALAILKQVLREELAVDDRSLHRRGDGTSVWLVTGVNGTGKTTSIGKLAARHTREGEQLVLAAADTFRAAAAEQLQLWGERAGARVVRHGQGADPAAVAFDGYKSASSSAADLLLVDTAGRLQNKTELMAELTKVKRVLEREAGPCDEVLLVLDATTGQNGLAQAKAFQEAVQLTGVVLTKLDGTAKGGIVIAIQRQLGIPVKLVGLGEDIDDLADFDADAFVEALFADVAQEAQLDAATGDGHGAGDRQGAGAGVPQGRGGDGRPVG